LSEVREKLEWESARLKLARKRLNRLEKEAEAESRAILSRLANGAALQGHDALEAQPGKT
jgi:hypothetical protein